MAKRLSRSKVLARLEQARGSLDLVRIARGCDDHDLEGYVMEIGTRWVTLAIVAPTITLNGWSAIRIADIDRVRVRNKDGFVRRALELHGEWPPPPPPDALRLDGTRALIRSVARVSPLVTLHIEHVDPDVCYIGVPIGWPRRAVSMLEVTPRATWEREPCSWRLKDVSRVEFGGGYERALAEVAGTPPVRGSRRPSTIKRRGRCDAPR